MKHFSVAIVLLLLTINAFGEQCIVTSGEYEGRTLTWAACSARVDEVIKVNEDGFVQTNYIVQYKGQRLVVTDPLSRSDHVVGEQICFQVDKFDLPPDARSRGFRILNAAVYEPKPGKTDCNP